MQDHVPVLGPVLKSGRRHVCLAMYIAALLYFS